MNNTISKFQPIGFNPQENNLSSDNINQVDNVAQSSQASSIPTTPNTNYQDILNSLIQRNEIQHTNIIEQKKVIENAVSENKLLKETIEDLKKELGELKNSLHSNNNQGSYSNGNDELLLEIRSLKEKVDGYEQDKREQQITPLLELLRDYGVDKDMVEKTFNEVQQIYGVNLIQNPNKNLLEIYLQNQGYTQTPQANSFNQANLPSGGYYNNDLDNPSYQVDSQEFIARKQEILDGYDRYLSERKNKIKY